MSGCRLLFAATCTATHPMAVGTRIRETATREFLRRVEPVIAAHDFAAERVLGQAVIDCPTVVDCVSCGIGRRTESAHDYVLRPWRGRVEAFLRRSLAAPCAKVRLVVYTREAYLADPDVQRDPVERACVEESDCSHVLVAVLAEPADAANSPVGLTRFVANLAGGNHEAATWSADEIRAMAKDVIAYDDAWCVVAD